MKKLYSLLRSFILTTVSTSFFISLAAQRIPEETALLTATSIEVPQLTVAEMNAPENTLIPAEPETQTISQDTLSEFIAFPKIKEFAHRLEYPAEPAIVAPELIPERIKEETSEIGALGEQPEELETEFTEKDDLNTLFSELDPAEEASFAALLQSFREQKIDESIEAQDTLADLDFDSLFGDSFEGDNQ